MKKRNKHYFKCKKEKKKKRIERELMLNSGGRSMGQNG